MEDNWNGTYLGLAFLGCALLSYLLGSVNFGVIISKDRFGKDIRESGSGNAGATNMYRTYGKKAAALTFLGDVLKNVCKQLNDYPYTTIEYEMLKESTYPYTNIERINQEKERILLHLEAIKADCNALAMDVQKTLKLKDVVEEDSLKDKINQMIYRGRTGLVLPFLLQELLLQLSWQC